MKKLFGFALGVLMVAGIVNSAHAESYGIALMTVPDLRTGTPGLFDQITDIQIKQSTLTMTTAGKATITIHYVTETGAESHYERLIAGNSISVIGCAKPGQELDPVTDGKTKCTTHTTELVFECGKLDSVKVVKKFEFGERHTAIRDAKQELVIQRETCGNESSESDSYSVDFMTTP